MIPAAAFAALESTATEHGSSRVAELQRCAVGHELRYELGVMPTKDAIYFDVGRYGHACLRYVNEGWIVGDRRYWGDVIDAARHVRAKAIESGSAQPVAWDEIDPIDEAERLVGIYYAKHGEDNAGWGEEFRLKAAELPLEWPEIRATARADLILMRGDELQLSDTKFRGRVLPKDRGEYAEELATNEQFLRLSALTQRHYGLASPPPIWLDAVIKSTTPPRDPATPWPVDRLLVRFTQEQIDAWAANQRKLVTVTDALRRLPVVRNYHECAPPMGSRCWAFGWCHGNDAMKAKRYRVRSEETGT